MKEYFSYDKNTKLNAVMLLQRRALQKQIDKFQNLLINEENKSTTEVFSEISFPNYLSLRFDINKKIIDDFEMTILGILDSDGRISTTARLQDFLLLMTRIIKMDQRALCLYILNERLDSTCGQAFLELGGYRLLKRYLKMAEEEECIAELKLIINICKCIPFDAIIITETEIGKSINKLLKYHTKKENSNNNTQILEDIASLQKDVKALKELWKNSVSTEISDKNNKELQNGNGSTSTAVTGSSSAAGGTATKAKVTLSPETMDLLDGINERLFAQKRLIQQQQQLQLQHQHSQSHVLVTPLSEVSIDDSVIESKITTPPTLLQPVTSSIMGSNMKSMFIDAQKNKFTQKPSSSSLSSALLHSGQQQDTTAMSIDPLTGVVTVSLSSDNDSSVRSSGSGDGSSSPGTPTTTINANTLARRTAGVELMVDKAKKLLAAQELSAQLEHSAHANVSNINGNYMKDSFNAIMNDTSGLDNNANNIVNELAGISIMETADGEPIGLLSLREVNKPLDQYANLKSALKKKTTADVVVDITASPLTTTAAAPADTDVSTSTTATTTKRPIKWADVEGGSIKEVRTFEVKKLKTGSVATYKSHREMVRKERQLEKSTNISKINEAMQATVPWARPAKRILSFEMQEYACGAVESPEAEAQSKRLAHVLEARYIDDSAIPSDPDELIFSIYADEFAVGTTGGIIGEEIPWVIAGSDGDSMLTGIISGGGIIGGDESDSMVELFQLVTRVTGYPVPVYNNISSGSASTSSSLVSAEFSQELINSLPECLRGLEIELVLALVQDENNILEILNDNGTVNEWKVAQMRQKLHLPPRHNDHYLLQQSQPMQSSSSIYGNQFNTSIGYGIGAQQQQQSYQQQQQLSGDGYNNYDYTQGGAQAQTQQIQGSGFGIGQQQQQQQRQRMSRFSPATSIAGGVSDDMNIQQQPWQQQQQQGFGSSSGGFQQQQQQDPYGRQNSGTGMMRGGRGGGDGSSYQPQQQDSSVDIYSEIIGSTGGGGGGAGGVNKLKRKFPTSTGNVPCKFFNTAKGCQFGDKCSFAHLAPENSNSGSGSGNVLSGGGHMRGSSSGGGGNRQQQRGGSGSSSGSSAYQQRNSNNSNNNNLTSPKKSRFNSSDNNSSSRNSKNDGNNESNADMNTTADSSNTSSSVDAFGRDIIQ